MTRNCGLNSGTRPNRQCAISGGCALSLGGPDRRDFPGIGVCEGPGSAAHHFAPLRAAPRPGHAAFGECLPLPLAAPIGKS
jgi:hypothetical protein